MLTNSLNLPEKLLQEVEKYARLQGISVEQFILWALAEKVGVLSHPNLDSTYPNITYKQSASGKLTPIIDNSGIRVKTIVVAHYTWKFSITEIAQEYDLTEELIQEALAFYQSHKEEIDQGIAEEQGLELANV